jgi:uncharacterized protein involved in exopolysaccharide biosynthesis
MSDAIAGAPPTATTATDDRTPAPARWPWWLALYLACFAGASVGWFRTRPLFRSEVMVQFTPRTWGVTEPARPPLDPDFIAGQVHIAASERVVDQATRGPLWKKTGLPATPAAIEVVRRNLDVRSAPGGILTLAFAHPDPTVAQAVAQALARSYYEISVNRTAADGMTRARLLEDRRLSLWNDIARLDRELLETAQEYGAADLSILHTFRTQEMLRLEREVRDATSPATTRGTTRPAPAWLVDRYKQARGRPRTSGGSCSEFGT